jgi:hypothetical protein
MGRFHLRTFMSRPLQFGSNGLTLTTASPTTSPSSQIRVGRLGRRRPKKICSSSRWSSALSSRLSSAPISRLGFIFMPPTSTDAFLLYKETNQSALSLKITIAVKRSTVTTFALRLLLEFPHRIVSAHYLPRGRHFLQEDSPNEIGHALADFVCRVRSQ